MKPFLCYFGLLLPWYCMIAAGGPLVAESRIGPFRVSAVREHAEVVTGGRRDYEIVMRGTVDMDNTMTRAYNGFNVAFQPNLSLEITNTGTSPVVNPRITTNGKRRWWSLGELLKEVLAGAENDQERALMIWDFVRKHRHHDAPLFTDDELHDPVKMLCIYGGGLCDDSANVGCSLLYHAGLNKTGYGRNPKIRELHGHVVCEGFLGGGYQFLDIDEDAFYLDRDNQRPVSGDTLARDHDLAKREHAYGPIFQGWDVGQRAASLFGADDGAGFRAVAGHRMDLTLRSGESITLRWDNRGKYASEKGQHRRAYWGNSRLRYQPPVALARCRADAAEVAGLIELPADDSVGGKLAAAEGDGHLVYEIRSPYVVCGGRVQAGFVGAAEEDQFALSLSLDGKSWRPLWHGSGRGKQVGRAELDPLLQVHQRPPKYDYAVRVAMHSASPASARLGQLVLETDVMASPHALPRLSLGRNQVAYRDESPVPGHVRIVHRWRESNNITPPPPPPRPQFPPPGAVVHASTVTFRWPPVGAARHYHIQVSRYPDMKLPYRTAFDLVIDRPQHGSPYSGMFSPNTDYYWRVRSQNKHGVWGTWSDVWRFRWSGPRPPIEVHREPDADGGFTIHWRPDPRGPQPVAYEVYGSDQRGFSIRRESRQVQGLGERPGNLLGSCRGCSMKVVDAQATRPVMNRCYYRVVAVDDDGVRSGASGYVELPHPHVYSQPPAEAVVGRDFRYRVLTLRSLGDLQYRYTPPGMAFWEREEYEMRLVEGPEWLQLDPRAGVLSGRPEGKDVGCTNVEIEVARRYPHEVSVSERGGRVFQKTGPPFQARCRQRFRLEILP